MSALATDMWGLAAFALAVCLLGGAANVSAANAQAADGFPEQLQPQLRPGRVADAVAVGDLGTVEGPIAGTLTDTDGGLGRDMWGPTERAIVEAILAQAPVTSPSSTGRLLLRKLLLTAAPPPTGRAQGAFNALRIRKLLEGGFVADAADLARNVRSTDITTQQAQAEAFLYAARDADACGEATLQRMQGGESFWIELRAYCYALAADEPALELTRAVMEQQGIVEGGFLSLVDALLGRAVPDIAPIVEPDAIALRLLARRWFDILPPTSPDRAAPYLRVVFAFAVPDDPRSAGLPLALTDLAMHATARDASPVMLLRAAMALGLFEATGRDMPPDARTRVAPLLQMRHAGTRPSQLALQRIDAAALAGRRGEVMLGTIDALGPKGPRDLPPEVIVRLVRALRTAGINDGARALTNEALLTHSTGT